MKCPGTVCSGKDPAGTLPGQPLIEMIGGWGQLSAVGKILRAPCFPTGDDAAQLAPALVVLVNYPYMQQEAFYTTLDDFYKVPLY